VLLTTERPNPIRNAAEAEVAAFLSDVGLDGEELSGELTLVDGVLLVVDKLKSYQEEGLHLRPEFYVFSEKDHPSLKNDLEANHFFEIVSSAPRNLDSFANAIKHCAPLAHGVWAGFIKLRERDLTYGVMRRRYSVISSPVLSHEQSGNTPFVRIRQIEHHAVELLGPRERRELSFNVAKSDTETSSQKAREDLLDCLTEKTWPAKKAAVRSLLQEVIDRALRHGHGFLVAVSESEDERTAVPAPPTFASGLVFNKWIIPAPLKVAELLKWQMLGSDAESAEVREKLSQCPDQLKELSMQVTHRYAEIEAWVDLISSLLMSDGITWFDNRGRVLGYRLFVESSKDECRGGARSMAFSALAENVKSGTLRAVFMQSQDRRAQFVI
jgi:hypothetical protein